MSGYGRVCSIQVRSMTLDSSMARVIIKGSPSSGTTSAWKNEYPVVW